MVLQATELMHNDWYSGLNASNKRDRFQFDIYNLDFWGDCEPQPIPLTPEFMFLNGFIKRGGSHAYIKPYRCYDIYVDLKYNDIEISKICGRGTDDVECEFSNDFHFETHIQIHQLQHALRLCGINELADNFKIE